MKKQNEDNTEEKNNIIVLEEYLRKQENSAPVTKNIPDPDLHLIKGEGNDGELQKKRAEIFMRIIK